MLERGVQRRRQFVRRRRPDNPDRGPQPRRLDEHGQPEGAQPGEHALAIGGKRGGPDRAVVDLRHTRVRHQLLEHQLVHAQRRGEYAGADVRDVEAFEQALHGPVLAERSVQHREDDVDTIETGSGLDLHNRAVPPPHAVAADLDRDRVVTGF